MASIKTLKVGQIVWSVIRQKVGNTTMIRDAVFPVKIISIDLENGTVVASWNGNRPTTCYEREIKNWKVKEPKSDPLF